MAASLAITDDVIASPGANSDRHRPQFENPARASELVDAPTAMAVGARAGDTLQASTALLPAATMTGTPAATTFATAVSSAVEAPPPSDRLATAGLRALRATKSRPAITPLSVPPPLQSSTRTGASVTCLATP